MFFICGKKFQGWWQIVLWQAVREAATICLRPLQVDLWPFDLESGVRVTCDVGYLCANFSLPRPLCYTADRCQTRASLNAPTHIIRLLLTTNHCLQCSPKPSVVVFCSILPGTRHANHLMMTLLAGRQIFNSFTNMKLLQQLVMHTLLTPVYSATVTWVKSSPINCNTIFFSSDIYLCHSHSLSVHWYHRLLQNKINF